MKRYVIITIVKEHEEISNNHNSCCIEMPEWVNKTIKHTPREKSLKAPFEIYLDLECLLKNLVKTILIKILYKKKLDMSLLTGQCL